jgi:hypothetical protein
VGKPPGVHGTYVVRRMESGAGAGRAWGLMPPAYGLGTGGVERSGGGVALLRVFVAAEEGVMRLFLVLLVSRRLLSARRLGLGVVTEGPPTGRDRSGTQDGPNEGGREDKK